MIESQVARKKDFLDECIERAIIGQREHLAERLKAGFPLHYADDNGDWVRENPDGTIEVLRKGLIKK